MGTDLYFFEQLATHKIPRRYRKLPEELPESLRFAHLNPKVAALLASKERAQKPDNEDPFGDGMGKKSLLPDINAAFQNVRNQFDTVLSNDEDSQRYLFEETKLSSPSILEQLSRIIYYYEDLYKHIPKSLEYQLMSGYQEFTSDVTVVPREWQTNEMKEQYAAKQLQEANSEEEASDNDLTGRSKSRIGLSDRSISEVGTSRMNSKRYGKAKSSLMDISDDNETVMKSESRTGRRTESRTSVIGSQNKNYLDVGSMSRVGSRRKGSTTALANQMSYMQTINFQLSNSVFDDKGWIQMKGRHEEVDQNAVLEYCVKHLQESMRQIADQRQKEFEQGFDKTVTIRYYGDSKKESMMKYRKSPLKSAASVVQKGGKPRIPTIVDERNEGKKLMEATHIDGSSIIYYPSGRPAVVCSAAGFGRPGYYTVVYEDGLDSRMLACFTPSGRGVCYYDNGVVRFLATEKGGHITETDGKLIRKWKWPQANVKITEPIGFQLNSQVVFRCIGQNQMLLVFNCQKEMARFNVGPAPDAEEYKPSEDTDQLLTAFTFSSKAAKDLMRIFAPKKSKRKGRKVSGSSISSRGESVSSLNRKLVEKQIVMEKPVIPQITVESPDELLAPPKEVVMVSPGAQDDKKPLPQTLNSLKDVKPNKESQVHDSTAFKIEMDPVEAKSKSTTKLSKNLNRTNMANIQTSSTSFKKHNQGDAGSEVKKELEDKKKDPSVSRCFSRTSEEYRMQALSALNEEGVDTKLLQLVGDKRKQDLKGRPLSGSIAITETVAKEQLNIPRPKSSIAYTSVDNAKQVQKKREEEVPSELEDVSSHVIDHKKDIIDHGCKGTVTHQKNDNKKKLHSSSKAKLAAISEVEDEKDGVHKALSGISFGISDTYFSKNPKSRWKSVVRQVVTGQVRPWFISSPTANVDVSQSSVLSLGTVSEDGGMLSPQMSLSSKEKQMEYQIYTIAQKLKQKVMKKVQETAEKQEEISKKKGSKSSKLSGTSQIELSGKSQSKLSGKSQFKISGKSQSKLSGKSQPKYSGKKKTHKKTTKSSDKPAPQLDELALLEQCKEMARKGMEYLERKKTNLEAKSEGSFMQLFDDEDSDEYQSKSQSTEIYKLLQDFPDKVTYEIEADKELAKLQRKARNLVDDWMEHYRLAVGLQSPHLQAVSDTPNYSIGSRNIKSAKVSDHQLTIRKAILGIDDEDTGKKKRIPSAPLGASEDVQLDDDLKRAASEKLTTNGVTFEESGADSTITPSAMTVINRLTDTTSRRSARSRASTSARSGSPSRQAPALSERVPSALTGNRSHCPLVIRQQYLGYDRPQCRCSRHHIPFIMDIELDDFVNTETPEGQLIVIMVVSSLKNMKTRKPDTEVSFYLDKHGRPFRRVFPGITKAEEMLNELYANQNRNRTRPCIQSRSDVFRVFKYDINTAAEMSDHTQPLLLTRHNVVPGMFLMYCDGKLLFCDHIFNGYGNARKDFKKQIMKSRHDSIQGFSLPKDFRFSPSRGKSGLRSAWGGEIGGAGVDKYSSPGTVVDATLVPIHRPISSSSASENSREIHPDPVKETVDLGPFHKEIQVRLRPLMMGYKLPAKRSSSRRPFLPHLEGSQVPSGGPINQHESVNDWLATSHPGTADHNISSMYSTSMSTSY